MKISLTLVFLVITCNTQAQTEPDYSARIGLTGLILPNSNYEFMELELDHRFGRILSLGMKAGHFRQEQSFTEILFTRQYVSIGSTWHTIKCPKIFLDPSVHITYLKLYRSSDASYFSGGGLSASLKLGYSFNRLEVGFKAHSMFNMGRTHDVSLNLKIFDYYFDIIQYGFHIGYKI